MYIENKSSGLDGPARIGRVFFSKSGQSLTYQGKRFHRLKGYGFKSNYYEEESGEHFWISGPRKDGRDRLYDTSSKPIEIDQDVDEEYWTVIRNQPMKRLP